MKTFKQFQEGIFDFLPKQKTKLKLKFVACCIDKRLTE